jgi:uncharacterized protein DUF3179
LKGRALTPVTHDEISFAVWKRERPESKVLEPDPRVQSQYAPANWEERVEKAPVVTPSSADDPLPPRALVIGIKVSGASKAYPLFRLQQRSPVSDTLGGIPILIIVGEDKKSVRAFERNVEGAALEFTIKPGSSQLIDAGTGSVWDFSGKCANGSLRGQQLRKVRMFSDYWFDWKTYHPDTAIY